MEECKFNHTDRTGLYILVFLIFFKVFYFTPTRMDIEETAKKETKKLETKIDSLNAKIAKLDSLLRKN